MAAPDGSITQNPNEKWMIVTARRNRRRGKPMSQLPHTTEALIRGGSAGPWTPIDTETDPERESNLLQKMRSSLNRVEASKFYLDLLQQLQSPSPVRDGLDKIRKASDDADLTMVVYGIGSIESDGPPRLQLSLAILLADRIGIGRTEIFDPVLSSTECRVIEALGCAVLSFNDCGRRAVHGPTLFFMPHCEAGLYDGLLEANWRPSRLNRMTVLGNSFHAYAAHASLVGRPTCGRPVPYLMEAERLASEVEVGTGGDEGVFFRAFQDTSWHFFDLDHDMDLPHLLH
ncbi:hypothetical protein QJS04_geneDACA008917 [Acorus gramineus]|uniref:SRR1-like domain-containing protein n=1 Tax=Acorus gramineus TaxID=55184 RepID=A0AAV9ADT8_ACOGR|nr:hypothetical protein QJS04_geneDACA008917 [Acorus gramineus]